MHEQKTSPTRKSRAPRRVTTPTHDEIARRAYALFLQRGGQHGADCDDWLAAERELMPPPAVRASATKRAAKTA